MKTQRIGWLCVMLLHVALAWPAAAQADERDELQRLVDENQALRAQVDALTAELEALRSEIAVLKTDNTVLTQETRVLEQQTVELQAMADAGPQDPAMAIQAERIHSEYDGERDRTVVTFGAEPLDVEGSAGEFYFSLIYFYAGQDAVEVQNATFFLQTYRAGRLFQGQEAVEFQVNGEPMSLPIAGYDLTPRKAGVTGRTRVDRSDEIVKFTIDRDTLHQLGDARSLSIDHDRVVVTFDPDDLAALRAVAQRMHGE